MDSPKPKRRWFRFSLRTMLIVVTLICIWLGWSVNWIRQRHRYLEDHPEAFALPNMSDKPVTALGFLWMLWEPGRTRMYVMCADFKKNADYHRKYAGPEAERARELFPEAIIVVRDEGIIWNTWNPGEKWEWASAESHRLKPGLREPS